MNISMNELLCFDYFKGLRLLAGRDGLSRPVSSCGMLDYELDPQLNKKFFYTNFKPYTLTLSSLFFAKDNPFQIMDAVKYLVSQEGSGLIIKNVFRLPIHESIIRYADYKNFPLFLMDDFIMFEDVIIQVFQCINAVSGAASAESVLDRLLYQDTNASEKELLARQLLPSLHNQYLAVHLRPETGISIDASEKIKAKAARTLPAGTSYTVAHYRRGAFLLLSNDAPTEAGLFETVAELVPEELCCSIGMGMVHFKPEEFDIAIKESLFASTIHYLENKRFHLGKAPYLCYNDLGIYRALLPVLSLPALTSYSRQILEPVAEFDAENKGKLLETLLLFVQCGGDLHLLSRETGQHENTIRYRLKKISALTGLQYQKPAHYEELALAARIYLLSQENLPL